MKKRILTLVLFASCTVLASFLAHAEDMNDPSARPSGTSQQPGMSGTEPPSSMGSSTTPSPNTTDTTILQKKQHTAAGPMTPGSTNPSMSHPGTTEGEAQTTTSGTTGSSS